jgi:hypothetical protein
MQKEELGQNCKEKALFINYKFKKKYFDVQIAILNEANGSNPVVTNTLFPAEFHPGRGNKKRNIPGSIQDRKLVGA